MLGALPRVVLTLGPRLSSKPLCTLPMSTSEEKRITYGTLKIPLGSHTLLLTFHWPEQVTWPHLIPGGQGSTILSHAQNEKQKYLVNRADDCHSFLDLHGPTYSTAWHKVSVGWESGQQSA